VSIATVISITIHVWIHRHFLSFFLSVGWFPTYSGKWDPFSLILPLGSNLYSCATVEEKPA